MIYGNDNSLLIESQIGLGFFKFGVPMNQILTEIRDRAEYFNKVDIVTGESPSDPIYIVIINEGIKLRFDSIYQILDLIEIDTKQNYPQRFFNIFFKNEIILGKEKSNLINLTYNKINSIFGPSQLPSSLDDNKYILLKYDGISFLFINGSQDNDEYIKYQNLTLIKIILFGEKTLKESIYPDNGILEFSSQKKRNATINHLFNIKIEYDKGIILYSALDQRDNKMNPMINNLHENQLNNNHSINNNGMIGKDNKLESKKYDIPTNKSVEGHQNDIRNNQRNENSLDDESIDYEENIYLNNKLTNKTFQIIDIKSPIFISLDENLDSILFKLKNPNFVYVKSKNVDHSEYENISISNNNQDEFGDFYLNYYSLGIDLLIDGKTSKLKNIKLHTNNPFSIDFGIWNRAPFSLELNKNLLKKLNETFYDGNCSSRKVSEDYNTINNRNSLNNNLNIQLNNINNNLIIDENKNSKNNTNINANKVNSEYRSEYHMVDISTSMNHHNTYHSSNYNLNNNFTHNNNSNSFIYNNHLINNRRKKDFKSSFDNNEKSFNSANESYISLSSNLSDNSSNLIITPNIIFNEIVLRINRNSYMVYHRCETKLNSTIKYYCLDGLVFEILENNTMGSITIFKTCNPTP